VERGEPDGLLTEAWEAVRQPGNGGEGSGGQNSGAERTRARRVGNGGRDECPFIGSEGKQGGRTRKGIERPVVAASMLAVQFGGKGKWRVEWGVKRGESAAPFLGEVGSSGRPVGLPEEEDSRAADRVGPPVIEGEGERWAATGPEGGEREVGSGWGRNRKWSDSRNKILSNFI
jgi:hypothetical protein